MWHGIASPAAYIKGGLQSIGINGKMVLHLVLVIGMLFVYDLTAYIASQRGSTIFTQFNRLPKAVRWGVCILVVDLMVRWLSCMVTTSLSQLRTLVRLFSGCTSVTSIVT